METARTIRPQPLPADFADGVMRRIAEGARLHRKPILVATRLGFLATAVVAVMASALVGRTEPVQVEEAPPACLVFGLPKWAAHESGE